MKGISTQICFTRQLFSFYIAEHGGTKKLLSENKATCEYRIQDLSQVDVAFSCVKYKLHNQALPASAATSHPIHHVLWAHCTATPAPQAKLTSVLFSYFLSRLVYMVTHSLILSAQGSGPLKASSCNALLQNLPFPPLCRQHTMQHPSDTKLC